MRQAGSVLRLARARFLDARKNVENVAFLVEGYGGHKRAIHPAKSTKLMSFLFYIWKKKYIFFCIPRPSDCTFSFCRNQSWGEPIRKQTQRQGEHITQKRERKEEEKKRINTPPKEVKTYKKIKSVVFPVRIEKSGAFVSFTLFLVGSNNPPPWLLEKKVWARLFVLLVLSCQPPSCSVGAAPVGKLAALP